MAMKPRAWPKRGSADVAYHASKGNERATGRSRDSASPQPKDLARIWSFICIKAERVCIF